MFFLDGKRLGKPVATTRDESLPVRAGLLDFPFDGAGSGFAHLLPKPLAHRQHLARPRVDVVPFFFGHIAIGGDLGQPSKHVAEFVERLAGVLSMSLAKFFTDAAGQALQRFHGGGKVGRLMSRREVVVIVRFIVRRVGGLWQGWTAIDAPLAAAGR
jgi:hypothetical protein